MAGLLEKIRRQKKQVADVVARTTPKPRTAIPEKLPYEKEWNRYKKGGGALGRKAWQTEWEKFKTK